MSAPKAMAKMAGQRSLEEAVPLRSVSKVSMRSASPPFDESRAYPPFQSILQGCVHDAPRPEQPRSCRNMRIAGNPGMTRPYFTVYSFPSAQPTYTASPATTGEVQTLAGSVKVHSALPVLISRALRLPLPCML